MQTCGTTTVKYALFAFNLIFALSGAAAVAAGAVVLAKVSDHNHFLEDRAVAPPVVLIVAGAIVFVVASLGCYGAAKESRVLLLAFACCLVVVLVLEVAAGAAGAALRREGASEMLRSQLRSSMANYTRGGAARQAWDSAQRELECCGVSGPSDWLGEDSADRALPYSCCHATRAGVEPPTEAQCKVAKPSDIFVYQDGCEPKLRELVSGASDILAGVGLGIAFVEIVGIGLSCWLAAAIKRGDGGDRESSAK